MQAVVCTKAYGVRKYLPWSAAAIVLLWIATGLNAAPLTWFPAPSLNEPVSGAATVVASGFGNLLIGGDSFYSFESFPESLVATNLFWTALPPMFSVNIGAGAAANGGIIVVYGGSDGTTATSAVIGYDPSGDPALTLASMSVARADLGYASDGNGFAYAIGGVDDSGQALSSVERYDPDTDTWAAVAGLPTPRYLFPAVFDGTNSIYIFGGRTNTASGTEIASVLRYSVSANTWTAMAPMPAAVAGSAAALGPDGKIYVVGGVADGVTTNVVQVYDPAANSWAISTPLPEGLSVTAMGVDSLGRLLVMGGMDAGGNDVGDVWRSQQLGIPDSAPAFTQYPGTNAAYQVPYASAIAAAGNPQPTYLVVSGPTGLQVDNYSGAITWTPQGADQIGAIPVTIRATNYAGFADWNFTITVTPPPPTAPTNLTVTALTENSVNLAWDPESPLVGPVTYTVYYRYVVYQPKGGSRAYYAALVSGLTTPAVTIGGLAVGSTHTYAVAAVTANTTSSLSQNITITTLSPQPPTNLRVTGLTSTSTSLAWDPSPGPVPIVSYSVLDEIYYTPISGTVETNVSGITGTSATFTGQTPGLQHYYFVYAHDASGNSSSAAIVGVFNPTPTPATLSNLTPVAGGGVQFTVQCGWVQTTLVQATTNIADPTSWVTIATNPPSTSTYLFSDPAAGGFPMRFYRVVSP